MEEVDERVDELQLLRESVSSGAFPRSTEKNIALSSSASFTDCDGDSCAVAIIPNASHAHMLASRAWTTFAPEPD